MKKGNAGASSRGVEVKKSEKGEKPAPPYTPGTKKEKRARGRRKYESGERRGASREKSARGEKGDSEAERSSFVRKKGAGAYRKKRHGRLSECHKKREGNASPNPSIPKKTKKGQTSARFPCWEGVMPTLNRERKGGKRWVIFPHFP